MNDLKAYQALASQIEQVIDLLLQDHSDRLRWRTEVLKRLDERPTNGHGTEVFLTKAQAHGLWSITKKLAPWIVTALSALGHLLIHYHH